MVTTGAPDAQQIPSDNLAHQIKKSYTSHTSKKAHYIHSIKFYDNEPEDEEEAPPEIE